MSDKALDPEDVLTGQRLKAVMRVYGLKQDDLAQMLGGLKQNTISQYLNGKRAFPPQYARILRAKLGVSFDYIYCGDHGTLPIPLANAILRGQTLRRPTD
jgi:transcriptional regulator with XRE-family HTH domain